MALNLYSVSAPGSLMLLGEHAVLRYNEAIVCAIDKRITVKLSPQNNAQVIIRSNEFAELVTTLDEIKNQQPYEYVLAAVLSFRAQLTTGCVIEIASTFSSKVGFGSSAAVTVAVVAVLTKWLGLAWTKPAIFNRAKQIMLTVQGAGSGADLAASIYGGVIHYTMVPFAVEALPLIENITAVYSGSKLATKEVLAMVAKASQVQPELYNHIFQGITVCVKQAVIAIKQQDWVMFGRLCSIQQGFMMALGVSNLLLDTLVGQLKELGGLGAKISGSGLGDCVIGLGAIVHNYFPVDNFQRACGVQQLAVQVTELGLSYE